MPPKRKAPKRKSAKRKPIKRAPAKRKPAKRKSAKRKPIKRAPAKRKPAKPIKRKPAKRKPAKPIKRKPAKRKPAKRKAKRAPRYDTRQTDLGDVVVTTDDWRPAAGYQEYPIPDEPTSIYRAALDRLDDSFGGSAGGFGDDGDNDQDDDEGPEIVWLPTFDEVYDYIDALVEDYDLDPHDLFELAFGYADNDAA